MRRIFRYHFEEVKAGGPGYAFYDIIMPKNSTVLSVQAQRSSIAIWANVEIESDPAPRRFMLIETGKDIPNYRMKFLATVQLLDGLYVAHVFEVLS